MTRHHHLMLPAALVVSSITVGACGGSTKSNTTAAGSADTTQVTAAAQAPAATSAASTPPVAKSGPADACGLLTRAELSAALGADVGADPQSSKSGGGSVCQYTGVVVGLGRPAPRSAFDSAKTSNPKGQSVQGIGDAAFAQVSAPSGNITFIKGSNLVYITVISGLTDGTGSNVLANLAKTAAGRL